MEKVPQIVSERLRAAAAAVGHPDADVLTAFSEHSLRKSERAEVVEHLARCAECREVVALALPASDQRHETVRLANEGWLTWPVLRWGFIAAGVAAMVSFGVMRYQHRVPIVAYLKAPFEATAKEAKNLPPTPAPAASAEHRDKTTAAPPSISTDRKDLSSANADATPSAEMATPAVSGLVQSRRPTVGGPLPHGPRVQWQQNTNVQQPAVQSAPAKQLRAIPLQSAPPSASPETVEVSGEAALSANADSSKLQNKIDQQALQHRPAEVKVERSKPPATTVATAPMVNFPLPASPGRAQLTRQTAQANLFTAASILWTISASGTLQRSFDQGTSWEDIDVNNPSAMGAGVALMKAPAKAKEVITDSLAQKDRSVPLSFRAVASNGPDVWAGASGGLLYHTTDGGSHWTRVVPSTSGVSLTGDIVSLEFIDPQHGRVVTSTPEVWTTSDDGQSWQKQ